MMLLVTLSGLAFGGIGAAVALRTGRASVVQGLFPLVFVILFLSSAFFPQDLLTGPAATVAKYNPLSFIVEGIRDPVISSLTWEVFGKAIASLVLVFAIGIVLSSLRAQAAAQDGWLMSWRMSLEAHMGSGPAGGERDPSSPGRRDSGRPGADDLLPRPDLGLRRARQPRRLPRPLQGLDDPREPAPGRGVHRGGDGRQPRPRHRAGVVRPPAGLPRPATGDPRGARVVGGAAVADPGDLPARRRVRGRSQLARARRARDRPLRRHGHGHGGGAAGGRCSPCATGPSPRRH